MYHRLFIAFIFCIASIRLAAQTNVIIQAGAVLNESFGSGPINCSSAGSTFDYSQYAYLYTAAELNALPAGSTITGIAWNKTTNGATTLSGGGRFNIYLKNSTVSSYNSSFRLFGDLISNATLVYSNNNTAIPATTGFVQFPMATPFVYTGGNLEVMVDWNISAVAGNTATGAFSWQRTTVAKSIYGYISAAPQAGDVLLPAGANTGDISNTRPVVRFTIDGSLNPCTAPPSGGIVVAPDSACIGVNTFLSVTNASSHVTGLSYQWQSSLDSSSWTNIGTISSDSIRIAPYEAAWYRRITHCSTGSDTSSAKLVAIKSFSDPGCGCKPASGNCSGGNYISRVQLGSIDNSSVCTPGGYVNYADSLPPVDFLLTSSKFLTVDFVSPSSGNRYVQSWIDYNHDGLFNDGTTTLSTTGSTVTGTITIPATALTGLTRMRVRFIPSSAITSNPGPCGNVPQGSEVEDYLVNIIDANACTGAPIHDITIAGAASVCTSDSILLTTSGANGANTFTYQWQTSADSVVWRDIVGATAARCVAYQGSASFYRTRIGCGDQYVYTQPVKVAMKPLLDCYCKMYRTSCSSNYDQIKRVVFGTLDQASACSTNGYIDYSGAVAAPSLTPGTSIPLSVTIGGGFTSYVYVWIDYNMNGAFEASEYTFMGSGNGVTLTKPMNIPAGLNGGFTKMRIRNKSTANINAWDACNHITSGGETEDYLVKILGPAHCIPAGNSVCSGTDVINRVIFGSIDTTTTCSPQGFGDFTKGLQIDTIAANSYVPLSVQIGCSSGIGNVGVWIDFNQNGVYERSEFTLVGRDCGATISNDISIPTNALAGLTNMRIRTTADDRINPSDACVNYVNGETEEYNVLVQPYSVCPTNTWTGLAGNTDWNNAANWSCQQVPGVHSNVVINSGNVVIDTNVTVYSLNVNRLATVTVVEPFVLTVTH